MAFCSSHLQPHWWLEGLLPWAVIWIIWFWAFSLTSYFRSYLTWVILGSVHLLLTLKIVQGLVPFCVAVGKAFNCTYLDPLCVQYVSLPHCPNIFHISDISSVQQCPAVSSSLAVIRISWVTYRRPMPSHAVFWLRHDGTALPVVQSHHLLP